MRHRKPEREPPKKFHASMEFALGIMLAALAVQSWRNRRPAMAAALGGATVVVLLLGWFRVQRANEELRRMEESLDPRGADPGAIEPDVGLSRASLAVPIAILMALLAHFNPLLFEVAGERIPYRIEWSGRKPASPLRRGDLVLLRLWTKELPRGAVAWIETGAGWAQLRSVAAVAGDTLRTGAIVAYPGNRFVDLAYALAGHAVPVGPDSLAIVTRADRAGDAEVIELYPVSAVRGRAVAILLPPTRWRRLP